MSSARVSSTAESMITEPATTESSTAETPVAFASAEPAAPPVIVVQPSRGWVNLQLRAVWEYRELLYFLVWRDVKVRYKQLVFFRSTERTFADIV